MISNLLVIDIETVPCVANFESLSETWQQLWIDKISKTVPENTPPTESFLQRAGILAEFGKIVCISTAFFYQNHENIPSLKVKSLYGHDESELLTAFIVLCDRVHKKNPHFQFAGHNIKEFDIPYICRRMLINKIALPSYFQMHDKKPWEVKMFDTLNWWKFGDHKNYITLHLLANVLGIPTSKSDMDGSMVQHVYYQEGNLKRIADYCERDVIVTANVILHFNGLSHISEQQITIVS